MSIETIFKAWCVETKRSGGVLIGSSITEFFKYYTKYQEKRIAKIMVDNKWKMKLSKGDMAIWVVDIPRVTSVILGIKEK